MEATRRWRPNRHAVAATRRRVLARDLGHAVEHDRDDRLVEVRADRQIPHGRVARGGAGGSVAGGPGSGALGLGSAGLGAAALAAVAAARARQGAVVAGGASMSLQRDRVYRARGSKRRWALLRRSLVLGDDVQRWMLRSRRSAGKRHGFALRDGKLVVEYASCLFALRTGRARPQGTASHHHYKSSSGARRCA